MSVRSNSTAHLAMENKEVVEEIPVGFFAERKGEARKMARIRVEGGGRPRAQQFGSGRADEGRGAHLIGETRIVRGDESMAASVSRTDIFPGW
jgi:hypothetical protein